MPPRAQTEYAAKRPKRTLSSALVGESGTGDHVEPLPPSPPAYGSTARAGAPRSGISTPPLTAEQQARITARANDGLQSRGTSDDLDDFDDFITDISAATPRVSLAGRSSTSWHFQGSSAHTLRSLVYETMSRKNDILELGADVMDSVPVDLPHGITIRGAASTTRGGLPTVTLRCPSLVVVGFGVQVTLENLCLETSSTKFAVVAVASGAKVIIKRCKIKGNGCDGIRLQEAELVLQNSSVQAHGRGIYAERGSLLLLQESQVRNCGQEGVLVEGCRRGEIVDCTISGNAAAGAVVCRSAEHHAVNFCRCTFSKNKQFGIWVDDGASVLWKCNSLIGNVLGSRGGRGQIEGYMADKCLGFSEGDSCAAWSEKDRRWVEGRIVETPSKSGEADGYFRIMPVGADSKKHEHASEELVVPVTGVKQVRSGDVAVPEWSQSKPRPPVNALRLFLQKGGCREEWDAMSEEEKQPFFETAYVDKYRYRAEAAKLKPGKEEKPSPAKGLLQARRNLAVLLSSKNSTSKGLPQWARVNAASAGSKPTTPVQRKTDKRHASPTQARKVDTPRRTSLQKDGEPAAPSNSSMQNSRKAAGPDNVMQLCVTPTEPPRTPTITPNLTLRKAKPVQKAKSGRNNSMHLCVTPTEHPMPPPKKAKLAQKAKAAELAPSMDDFVPRTPALTPLEARIPCTPMSAGSLEVASEVSINLLPATPSDFNVGAPPISRRLTGKGGSGSKRKLDGDTLDTMSQASCQTQNSGRRRLHYVQKEVKEAQAAVQAAEEQLEREEVEQYNRQVLQEARDEAEEAEVEFELAKAKLKATISGKKQILKPKAQSKVKAKANVSPTKIPTYSHLAPKKLSAKTKAALKRIQKASLTDMENERTSGN